MLYTFAIYMRFNVQTLDLGLFNLYLIIHIVTVLHWDTYRPTTIMSVVFYRHACVMDHVPIVAVNVCFFIVCITWCTGIYKEMLKQRKLTTNKHLMNAEQRMATTSDEAINEMVHLRDAWRLNGFQTCNQNKWNYWLTVHCCYRLMVLSVLSKYYKCLYESML